MIQAILEQAFQIFSHYPYIWIFGGMLVAGESILLPAVYLSIAGKLSLPWVLLVALAATIFSDVVWYGAGRRMSKGGFDWLIGERIRASIARMSKPFDAHMFKVLFFSKFVYGTRTAAQVLAGSRHMPLGTYLAVNALSTISIMVVLVGLAYSIDITVGSLGAVVKRIEIAFLVFAVAVVAAHLIVGKIIRKTWSR